MLVAKSPEVFIPKEAASAACKLPDPSGEAAAGRCVVWGCFKSSQGNEYPNPCPVVLSVPAEGSRCRG